MGAFQTFLELVTRHELSTVLTGQGRGVHGEEHRDGRRVNVDAGEVHRIACRRKRVTDVEVVETCNQDDVARTRFFDRLRGQAFVAQNLLDTDVLDLTIVKRLGNGHVRLERTLLHAAHGQAAKEARVFEGSDLHERFCSRIALRGRDAFDNLVHQDVEVAIRVFHFGLADALTARTEHLVEV